MRVGRLLANHVEQRALGEAFAAETGFRLASNPDTVRAPDAAFVRRERIPATGTPAGYWPGAPDLAIEVTSPGDSFDEVEEKVLEWLAAGTRMVIVVNPAKQTATVYRGQSARLLGAEDTIDGEDVVPGWLVPVREIFA